MSKIKVLIFTNSFRAGGSERQAVELIKRLDRSKFEVMVGCFDKEGPFLNELPGNLNVESFPLTGFVSWSAIRQGVRFFRFVRRARFQILQCFDFYSNVFAIPLARLAGVPIILACRRDEAAMRTPSQHRTELQAYRFADGVVANAQAIKEQLIVRDKVPAKKVWVIRNGLDVVRFESLRERVKELPATSVVTVAVIANLRPEKGHNVFLDAACLLAKKFPHVQFVIAGNGSMKEDISTRVQELGLERSINMVGEIKNIPAFLASVDIAVLPSLKNEGLPNSVMEAMAASLPVVGTNTGGTPELIVDGLTGYVVSPGDAIALAHRVGMLCEDTESRRKMGEAGYRRIHHHFTVDVMAGRFENLFESLVYPSQKCS